MQVCEVDHLEDDDHTESKGGILLEYEVDRVHSDFVLKLILLLFEWAVTETVEDQVPEMDPLVLDPLNRGSNQMSEQWHITDLSITVEGLFALPNFLQYDSYLVALEQPIKAVSCDYLQKCPIFEITVQEHFWELFVIKVIKDLVSEDQHPCPHNFALMPKWKEV